MRESNKRVLFAGFIKGANLVCIAGGRAYFAESTSFPPEIPDLVPCAYRAKNFAIVRGSVPPLQTRLLIHLSDPIYVREFPALQRRSDLELRLFRP